MRWKPAVRGVTLAQWLRDVKSTVTRQTGSADGVPWNLNDLYRAVDDARITEDLDTALRRAQAFESFYRGKIDAEGDRRRTCCSPPKRADKGTAWIMDWLQR